MNPQYEPRSLEQAIAYLIEECGECVAAAGKSLRWGLDSVNPELPPKEQERNGSWLVREMHDVRNAMLRVEQYLGTTYEAEAFLIVNKTRKVKP